MTDFSTTCAVVILTSEDQNGIIRTIRLGIKQSAVKDLLTVIRKEANLTGLIKDESYNVSVLVTIDKGNGPYSVLIIHTTNENSEYFETLFGIAKQIPSRLCFFFASMIPSTTGSIRKTNYYVIHWIASYSV